MDLSKLPRMSKTPASPESTPPPASLVSPDSQSAAGSTILCPECASSLRSDAKFCDKCGAQLVRRRADAETFGFGAEAWISIALGIIVMFISNRPLEYWHSRSHPEQFTWTFQDKDGNPITYPQTAFYLPDVAFLAFAATLVLEGIVMLLARRLPIALMVSFVVILGVVLLNIVAMAKAYSEIGFQFLPALAVAFGVYLAIFQFNLFKSLQSRRQGAGEQSRGAE